MMLYKVFLLPCMLFIITTHADTNNGLFLKFCLGPGITYESSSVHDVGLVLAGKNHAIGWAFKDKYAIYYNEFGGLIRKTVDGYNYINTDAYGLGFSYKTSFHLLMSFSVAYSTVHFDHKWYLANTEKTRGAGYGCNLGLGKDIKLSKRFFLGPDIHLVFIKTENSDFRFLGTNINCALKFFLTPGKQK
jgi:hypothetical protein